MDKISEAKIERILEIKKGLATAGIDEDEIAILSGKISPIAYGVATTVIFTEIAGIPVVEILGTEED